MAIHFIQKNIKRVSVSLFFFFPFSIFLFPYIIAESYSVPGQKSLTPDIATDSSVKIDLDWNKTLNKLSSPFQDFGASLKTTANTPISDFHFTTSTIPEKISNGTNI